MTHTGDAGYVRDHLRGWLLPDGGPIGSLGLQDVERFCWYELPVKWMSEPAEYPLILSTLAELLDNAGRSRATAVCTSEATYEILSAWQRSPDQGRSALQRATDASPVTPPDTTMLTWGAVMGIDEAVARGNASRLLEQALDDGVLVPGARGYPAARITHLDRWLTTPHPAHDGRTPLDAIHSERRHTWAEAPPAARRRLRGPLADLLAMVPEVPDVPDDTAGPLRWLLESVGAGVTLTQAGYLPRALVIEATERYDWYLPGMLPRTERDVARLAELHELARNARLLAKCSYACPEGGRVRPDLRRVHLDSRLWMVPDGGERKQNCNHGLSGDPEVPARALGRTAEWDSSCVGRYWGASVSATA